jgi:tetraacyldisaccharide 4'-kinase
VESRQGVSNRLAKELVPLSQTAYLKTPRSLLSRAALKIFTFIWCEGGAILHRRSKHQAGSQSPLPVPVVSIGGITVGGSGKTPFTNYLAECLSARGHRPAILTRGYRRRSPARNLIFAPGTKVPVALTGDEPQIFLRSGTAPIGIGANRYQTAKILLSYFPSTTVLLLDDGFQHTRLKRDLDIVLIDGLDPFGQGNVVPIGRLREPLSALNRASVFVITRAEGDLRYESICRKLAEYNPNAPVFRTRLVSRHWRYYRTRSCTTILPFRRVAAFCGLGNPENFWRTLKSLGLEVVFRWAFPDHHVYQPLELQRIAHQARASGAEILVTTEKDRINCPIHLEKAIAPFDLAWLQIELQLENESVFFSLLEQALGRRAVA